MTDLLEEAKGLLAELPAAVDRRRLGHHLADATEKLRTTPAHLRRIDKLLTVLREIDVSLNELEHEEFSEMLDCALSAGEALSNAERPEDLRKAIDEYQNEFVRSVNTFHRAVQMQWRSHIAETYQPLHGIGRLLSSMNVPNQLGERMIALAERANAARNVADATDLQQTQVELRQALDALQKEQATSVGDNEVGDFIRAITENRATLSMVTSSVREWLDKHNALETFAVTPRQ